MRNKKAVSILLAYVLLITMAIALSVIVYNWLRFYVSPSENPECPEDVSLIIKDYICDLQNKEISITLKNNGLFNITGFVLRVHDREDAEIGLYSLTKIGDSLSPGEEENYGYDFSQAQDDSGNSVSLEEITLVEVQPFIKEKETILCKKVASQKVTCE
jgi:hypothetical protein